MYFTKTKSSSPSIVHNLGDPPLLFLTTSAAREPVSQFSPECMIEDDDKDDTVLVLLVAITLVLSYNQLTRTELSEINRAQSDPIATLLLHAAFLLLQHYSTLCIIGTPPPRRNEREKNRIITPIVSKKQKARCWISSGMHHGILYIEYPLE